MTRRYRHLTDAQLDRAITAEERAIPSAASADRLAALLAERRFRALLDGGRSR